MDDLYKWYMAGLCSAMTNAPTTVNFSFSVDYSVAMALGVADSKRGQMKTMAELRQVLAGLLGREPKP